MNKHRKFNFADFLFERGTAEQWNKALDLLYHQSDLARSLEFRNEYNWHEINEVINHICRIPRVSDE